MIHQRIINDYIAIVFQKYLRTLPDIGRLQGITSHLDTSYENEIVFYRIWNNKKSEEVFYKRLKKGKSRLIIVNREVDRVRGRHIWNVGEKFDSFIIDCVDSLYPVPVGKKYIGVTGTNGKTSVVHLASQIAGLSGLKVLSIGTLGVLLDGQKQSIRAMGTTPPNIDLRRVISDYAQDFDIGIFEVSSHGLDQERVRGIGFDVCVWTNFSQDHLDYHGDMDNYYESKYRIRNYLNKKAVILVPSTAMELLDRMAPEFERVLVKKLEGVPEFGTMCFNQVNLNLALAALKKICLDTPCELGRIKPVEGRVNMFQGGGRTVIVDFAHTPDGLLNVIKGVRLSLLKRVILLFGAGGNRDRLKRELMGRVADNNADYTYVTSDNPRDEEPEDIISQIILGFSSNRYEVVLDREEAIRKAIANLREDEVLIVAGKGSEDTIEKKGAKYPFSDRKIVKELLGSSCV